MALVLLCTVPSGEPEVVSIREELTSRLRIPQPLISRSLRPSLIHCKRAIGQDASRLVYMGDGLNDPQRRPSIFTTLSYFRA